MSHDVSINSTNGAVRAVAVSGWALAPGAATESPAASARPLAALGLLLLLASTTALAQAPPETPADAPPAAPADPNQPVPPKTDKPVEKLPFLPEMELPTFEYLLTGDPVDWVILEDNRVIRVDPLNPRPGTLDFLREQLAEATKERKKLSGTELEEFDEQLKEKAFLYILLPGEPVEYRLPMNMVLSIRYHEDLMLERIQKLLDEGAMDKGKELLNRLQLEAPDWPGFEATMNRTLFRDAELQMLAKRPETSLVVLEELFRRKKDYEGLAVAFGEATRSLMSQALERRDFFQARNVLERLKVFFPEHPMYVEQSTLLDQRAGELLTKAEAAFAQGQFREAAAAAEEAGLTWPDHVNLVPRQQKIYDRFQRLHVGVVTLTADGLYSPFVTDAPRRMQRLGEQPLFHVDRILNGSAQYRTRFFNEWDPFDLGRRMRFTLRSVRQPWERQGPLDANQAAQLLFDRLNPQHPRYDERLASYVNTVTVESPYVFTVTFHRVPARIEALLSRISPSREDAAVGAIGQSAKVEGTESQVQTVAFQDPGAEPEATTPLSPPPLAEPVEDGRGGFMFAQHDDWSRALFARSRPEPSSLPQYHVGEVVERKFESYDRVFQALERGEISAAVDLPSWFIRKLQDDKESVKYFHVNQHALPVTHVLQFHPGSKTMSNRLLRRALSYSINRERLLSEVVLRDPDMRHGRLVDTPFASSSYTNAGITRVQYYDIAAAATLVLAGTREIGDSLPPIKFVVPPEPVERKAAEQLVKTWKRIGLPIEVIDSGTVPVADWDIAYRKVQFTEPVIDLWPFLTAQDTSRLSDLDGRADWLRRDLIELDRITDWNRAVSATRDLLDRLNADVAYLPLWEVDQFLVVKKSIRNFPQVPVHCYDSVDQWIIGGGQK